MVLPGLLLTAATFSCMRQLSSVLLPTLLFPKKINYLDGFGKGTTALIFCKLHLPWIFRYLIIDFEYISIDGTFKNGNNRYDWSNGLDF